MFCPEVRYQAYNSNRPEDKMCGYVWRGSVFGEERKPVREVDAKWDAERRDDKGRIIDIKRDAKIERKKEKIRLKP